MGKLFSSPRFAAVGSLVAESLVVILTISMLFYCGCTAQAGWGGGSCGTVSVAPSSVVVSDSPEWRAVPGDDDQIALLRGGVQQGNYCLSNGFYRPLVNGEWGVKQSSPVAVPAWAAARLKGVCRLCECGDSCKCSGKSGGCCQCEKAGRSDPNFGLDKDRIGQDRFDSVNGREVTRRELFQHLTAADVPADSGKLRLTVIGVVEDCRKVIADMESNPALTRFRDQIAIQEYRPEEWPVQPGFVRDGKPVIYLQSPNGEVPMRGVVYPGPDALAKALPAAIRRVDPSYDPEKDPDLCIKPKVDPKAPAVDDPNAEVSPHAIGCTCLAAVCLILVASKRKQ